MGARASRSDIHAKVKEDLENLWLLQKSQYGIDSLKIPISLCKSTSQSSVLRFSQSTAAEARFQCRTFLDRHLDYQPRSEKMTEYACERIQQEQRCKVYRNSFCLRCARSLYKDPALQKPCRAGIDITSFILYLRSVSSAGWDVVKGVVGSFKTL